MADELAGPVIPADAEAIEDIRARLAKRGVEIGTFAVAQRMSVRVKAGEYETAMGRKPADERAKRYYWPAAR